MIDFLGFKKNIDALSVGWHSNKDVVNDTSSSISDTFDQNIFGRKSLPNANLNETSKNGIAPSDSDSCSQGVTN